MAAVHPRHAADGGAQAEGEAAVDQAGPIGHPFAVLLVHMGGEQISNDPGKEVHITLGKGLGEGELFPISKCRLPMPQASLSSPR